MLCIGGDIGGTKTELVLFKFENGVSTVLKEEIYPSQDYPSIESIIKTFLQGINGVVDTCCLGVAGPVVDGRSQITNLPWIIDKSSIKQEFHIKKVSVINDLEANAYGVGLLDENSFYTLNEGVSGAKGNKALVSPGTGLGEAGIFFDGTNDQPFACEGGHVDFGPKNEKEKDMWIYLNNKFGHVSYERVLSGRGLVNIYSFLIDCGYEKESKEVSEGINNGDSPLMISKLALENKSNAAKQALNIFVSILGAEAGNAALKFYALGGVYIGGGIAPKNLDYMKDGVFIESFKNKGRFANFLSKIPVKVILNPKTALYGSMLVATKRN